MSWTVEVILYALCVCVCLSKEGMNDIFHLVLRFKDVLCCEQRRKIDRFLDPIILIFYCQRHVLFRHE